MPKPLIDDLDPETLDWTPLEDGCCEKILSMDPETGDHTRLLRIPAGYQSDKVLVHDFWEEVYLLEGTVFDHAMCKTVATGTYSHLPPGTEHGPYSSEGGCITLEMRYGVNGHTEA